LACWRPAWSSGLAFAAYGGADLLLNFTNLRYCG
jgi:hypothetical protein